MANIIVRNYEHYNRALPNWDSPRGKYIGSKKQYEYEMKKAGMVSQDEGDRMVQESKKESKKYNGLEEKTMRFIHSIKDTADKKGNIKISDRYVKGLKEIGVKVDCMYDKLPKAYQQGGFGAES
jgi:hypothetical protein